MQPTAHGQTAPGSVLQVASALCHGSVGMVLEGSYRGQHAVIKMYGPDSHGLASYRRELHAYKAVLEPLQGRVVPRLLGAGHLTAGVWFIAITYVRGRPLSDMDHIPPAVAHAAMQALQHVHTASESFVQGDIRLANIMHMAPGQGDADASAAQCMVIDFGLSNAAATKAEQGAEQKALRCLLEQHM